MDNTLIILLLGISLILLFSLIITVMIYGEKIMRSRKIIRSGTKLVWPDHFEHLLEDHINNINDLIQTEKKRLKIAENFNKSGMDAINRINESFSIFGETKDTFEKELNFYKKGAEKNYVDRFLGKFVKFREYLQEELSNQENNDRTREVVGSLLELYDDQLLDIDVFKEIPKAGMNYKDSDCAADKPEVERTDDKTKDYQIISSKTPAFYYEIGDKKNYISKSKVTIFRYKGDPDGQNNRN